MNWNVRIKEHQKTLKQEWAAGNNGMRRKMPRVLFNIENMVGDRGMEAREQSTNVCRIPDDENPADLISKWMWRGP